MRSFVLNTIFIDNIGKFFNIFWCQFGTLWFWNVLQELWLTMGAIIDWAVDMSKFGVSGVLNTSSIV